MTEEVKVAPNKRGRPAKAKAAELKAAPAPAPAPKKELAVGMVAKSGLWKIEELRGDRVIVVPTEKHTTAYGRANITTEACKELFKV